MAQDAGTPQRTLRRRAVAGRHCENVHGTALSIYYFTTDGGRNQLQTNGSGALVQASQYLRHVSTTEGPEVSGKGTEVDTPKDGDDGSNYFVMKG